MGLVQRPKVSLGLLTSHPLLSCFPGATSGDEHTYQCRRHKRPRLNPWVGKIPWRRARQSTAVFLPGESRGQRSLAGYSPWGCKESDTTEVTEQEHTHGKRIPLELADLFWVMRPVQSQSLRTILRPCSHGLWWIPDDPHDGIRLTFPCEVAL